MTNNKLNRAYEQAMQGDDEPDAMYVPIAFLEKCGVPKKLLRRLRDGREVPTDQIASYVVRYLNLA